MAGTPGMDSVGSTDGNAGNMRPSPLVFIPLDAGQKIADRMRAVVSRVLALFPSLKYNLRVLGVQEPEGYVASALLSSVIAALLFGTVMWIGMRGQPPSAGAAVLAAAFVIFLIFFIFNMVYPGIRTRTFALRTDRDLAFALKDMLVEVESGIPLYEAMVNIAHSHYGTVSAEFNLAVKEISAGMPESLALQKMALKTRSEYFRKALWQLISALESGASLGPALRSVIETLETYQHKMIKDYSASLNFIVLLYMLIAAAIPSMGITFLIILSAFGGIGVNEVLLGGIVVLSLLSQIIIIGYVNSGRPAIYE